MKRKISISHPLVLTAVFYSLSFSSVSAAPSNFETNSGLSATGRNAGYGALMEKTPVDFYGNLIGFLLGFLGIIFLGYMIYAGYTWMLARGNEQEVAKAKRMIEQAIVGLVIVLAAYAITYAVGVIFSMVPPEFAE